MKRYITLALCALTVFGLGSCNKVHEEDIDSAIRTVTFQAQLGGDTRTGLALKFVPDWRETNLTDVHIYEINGDERIEGEDVEMDIPGAAQGDYEIALFKADFSNMTIIVNPPSNNAPRTRANEVYQYTSIVAPQDGNKKFTVPATQYPATSTLIDPHADFIVGSSLQDFSDTQAGKQVNLKFVRPVAISRLSIMNVEDAAIKQVKIYSSDKLTGSAAYDDVNFEDGTVAFDNSGSNVLTLDYGTGVAMPAEGIFNAYFVSLTGTKRITKIEVITNAQTLTKEFAGGKALTFKVPDFKSIAVNMAGSGSSEPGPGDPLPQNISFTKAGSAIETDSFDLYTGGTYVSPTVTGAATGATLTYESSDPAVATVSAAGVVTPKGVGETTITVVASAVEGYQAGNAEYVLTVTDSTPEAVDQSLVFTKGGSAITADEYDLYNGGTYVSPTLTGVAEGATVTWEILCTPEGCATITAEGVVTPVAQGVAVVTATASAVAPLYKETTLSYTLTIKDTTPVVGPTVTVNLEEADELVAGEKYVLVSNGFALVRDGSAASAAAFDATAMTIAVPTDLQSNVEWTLGTNTDSNNRGNVYDFSNGGYFFGILMNTAQNPYTYSVTLNTSKQVATNQTMQNHNVNVETGYVYYRGNSSSQYIYYDTEAQAWTNHAASNGTFDAAYGTKLYKLKDMRADQNPQFSAAAAEYDLYTNAWTVAVPTLSGAQGTVTYTSSDEAVAQVSSTGAITIMTTAKKGDTATITARAAGNDTYKPGEASYTITIVNSNPNVSRYNKVTSVDDLEAGAKYLIVYEGTTTTDNTPKVFNPVLNDAGTQFAKATSSAVDVTLSSGVIESSDVSDYEFTLESGYYLKADRAAKYIYPGTSGSSSVLLAESPASHALAITFNNGIAQISNGSGNSVRYIVWSTSSHYFSSNQQVSGSYSTGICLYKLDDGRQAQDISFSASAAEYDLYTSTWTVAVPALTGAQGTVTYSSSDESVAQVSATGAVTIMTTAKKGDTVTITASASGNETYKAGEASYTITIVDTTPVIPGEGSVYRKVTAQSELVAGGEYLVVYDNGTSSKVFNPIVSGSTFTTSAANAVDVTISGDTITSSELDASRIELRNFDGTNKFAMWVASVERYLILRRNNQSFVADASDDGYRSTFTVNGGTVTIVRDSYNLRYSSSNSYFQVSTSSSSNMALYKLDEGGTTPDPGTDPDPDPTTPTYTKVTSITSGGTYLIVSADAGNYNHADGTKAFVGDQNGTAATVNNASGVITGDYSAYEFVITASGSGYTLLGPNGYVTGDANSGNRYIRVSSTAGTMSLSMASDFTGTDGQVADAFYFYYTKTSGGSTSKEVLYYNADEAFKIGGTGRKYGVYLYKKN